MGFFGGFFIIYDEAQDTEIGGLRHTEGVHINLVLAQDAGHIVYTSSLVLQKD